MTHRILRMAGRCFNGAERDKGALWHAVPGDGGWSKALCGARPGDRGNGWATYPGDQVTCPRCLNRLTPPADTHGVYKFIPSAAKHALIATFHSKTAAESYARDLHKTDRERIVDSWRR